MANAAWVTISKKNSDKNLSTGYDIYINFIKKTIYVNADIKITLSGHSGKPRRSIKVSCTARTKPNFKRFSKFFERYGTDVVVDIENVCCKIVMAHYGYCVFDIDPSEVTTIASFRAVKKSNLFLAIPKTGDMGLTMGDIDKSWISLYSNNNSSIEVDCFIEHANFIADPGIREDESSIKINNYHPTFEPTCENLYIPLYIDKENVEKIEYNNGLCYCELLRCRRDKPQIIGKITPTIHLRGVCKRTKFDHHADTWNDRKASSSNEIYVESSSEDEDEGADVVEEVCSPSVYSGTDVCIYCGKHDYGQAYAFNCQCDHSPMCVGCSQIISKYCILRDIEFKCNDCNEEITEARVNLKRQRSK